MTSNLEAEFLKHLGDTFTPYVGREEGSLLPVEIRERRKEEKRRQAEARRLERQQRALAELERKRDAAADFEGLKELVCAAYGVTFAGILSSDRRPELFVPRCHLMWVAREHLGMRWVDIARAMKRDHSTVINGAEVFEKRYMQTPEAIGIADALAKLKQPSDPDT